jgi:AAA family ATPase
MYGYVGADIGAVVREAGTLAIKRCLKTTDTETESTTCPANLKLELNDLVAAIPAVRPSAMRSLFFETPPVRYSDIGGQASVIQKLKEAVEWPLLHPDSFQRLGVRPPKGVLLYGPPGCSKTILARACACESGVNFVAVKGPEASSCMMSCICVDQHRLSHAFHLAAEQIRWRIGTCRTRDIW